MKNISKKSLILVLSSIGLLAGCTPSKDPDISTEESQIQPSSQETVNLYGLKITKAPNKVVYKAGEKFDKTGMVVTATYDDLTSKQVTDYTFSPEGELTYSDTKITISYSENGITKTAVQEITIESSTTLSSIEIATPPKKTKYSVGEKFDPMGMVVKAVYADGTSREIVNYIISPSEELKTSDTHVTISYTEGEITKTVNQPIEVVDAYITGISIVAAPTKMEYQLGDMFDPTGLKVEATYSNNKKEEITDYHILPSGKLKANDTLLKVSVGEGENAISAYWKTKILIKAPEVSSSDYEGATQVLFADENNYSDKGGAITLEGGASRSTWSSEKFARLRCNKDTNKKIIIEHDFSSLVDKSNAGFMTIMNDSRGGTKVEISVDNKETWATLTEAGKETNMIPADYKYPSETIDGKPATDAPNRNMYYCYYKLGKYLKADTKKIFIRYSYEDPTGKGWVGIDTEGTDIVHSVTFYDKLNLSRVAGDVQMTTLVVKTQPTKTEYLEGEHFDPSGLVLEATWSDNSKTEISEGYTVENDRSLTVDDKEMVVSYNGRQVKVTINVSKPQAALSSIEITTQPTKAKYNAGESFDPTGMVVSAVYEDNTKVAITDYTYSPNGALKVTDKEIVITYKGKTAKVSIEVTKTKLDENDYMVATELNFNDQNNYSLANGAGKGAARVYKDGSSVIRLRTWNKANAYIQVQYKFEDGLDLSKAGFMFTGLHTRLGTVVKMSTDGETFTDVIKAKVGDKTIPCEWEEFEDGITNGGKTDSNMYRMYNHLAGLTAGATVTLRFGYEEAPSGAVDKEGADIFRSVVFYSSLDLTSVKK